MIKLFKNGTLSAHDHNALGPVDGLEAYFSFDGDTVKDHSGNGVGLEVYNSVSCVGVSGNGLERNKTNAYEVTTDNITMPDVFWYHEWWSIPNHATQLQILFGNADSSLPRLLIYRNINSPMLTIRYYNGSNVDINVNTLFTGYDSVPFAFDLVWDWINATYKVYQNGALLQEGNLTTPQKPSAQKWYFGIQSDLNGSQFADGWVDERRWYSREPSLDEIETLYYLR